MKELVISILVVYLIINLIAVYRYYYLYAVSHYLLNIILIVLSVILISLNVAHILSIICIIILGLLESPSSMKNVFVKDRDRADWGIDEKDVSGKRWM